MTLRIKVLTLVFLVVFIGLIAKLFSWQILRGKELSVAARSQYESGRAVSAPRGNILTSDNSWLAARGDAWLVFASLPDLKDNPKTIANELAPYFVEDKNDKKGLLDEVDRITGLLSKKEVVWVPLRHKVSTDVKKSLEALTIPGIGFQAEETRIYPEASVAAQLLGFVGKDKDGNDQGYFGLEGYYNLVLSGKPGFVGREKDAKGVPILFGDSIQVSAIGGVGLVTHIDKTIQLAVEQKLKDGIERYGASGGSAIVMDPTNGAILAMSSFPSYDPAKYSEFDTSLFKNPVVSSSFEPGSVFKIIIMASALDAGAVKPETRCDICSGPLKVDKYYIETWDGKYYPDSTMTNVIVHSDNIGMSFVGQKMGADKLYDYLNKFGIGKLTGIDLQGEATPPLRDKGTWNIVDLATASFGQGIAITPIQLIRAGAAIANGGRLVAPQVVGALQGEGWKEGIDPKIDGRIISEKAAKEITAMMVEAAKHGESQWTDTPGFKVAGKTGTAQIPIAGHYDPENTIASFIGFAPFDKPKFIMLVTLQQPKTSPWASETAAPLWYSIAKDLFMYFGIQPES